MANDPGAIQHSINRSTTELLYISSTRECPNPFEPQRGMPPSQDPGTSAELSESSDDDDEIEQELQRLQREVDEQPRKQKQHQKVVKFCQEHSSLARQNTRKLKSDRELDVELRQLDENLATLGEAKQKTEHELALANENLANLQNKWESLSIDHGSLRREHHQLQHQKDTMAQHNRKQLKGLQNELLVKDVEIGSLRERITTVSEHRNGLDEQLKQLQKTSGTQHEDLRNQTKAWDDRRMELQKHIQDLNREAKDRSASRERERARWQIEFSTVQEKLELTKTTMGPSSESQALAQTQAHLDHCRQRLKEYQAQVAGLQASEHKYRKDLETCQQELGEARMQAEIITLAAEEADRICTGRIGHLQAGKDAAEQSVLQLQNDLDETKRRLLDSDETVKRVLRVHSQAENDMAELRRRFASSEQTLRRLQDDAVDAHGKLEEASANTSNQLQVMGEKLKSSEAAANELRARESNIQRSLAASTHEITQLQTEKDGLHRQLSLSEGRLETATQTIQDLRNLSQSSRNDFETQLAELKRQNTELDRRLETAISDSQQTIDKHREKFSEYVQEAVGHMDWQDEQIRELDAMLGEACAKGTKFMEAWKEAHTFIMKKIEEGKILS